MTQHAFSKWASRYNPQLSDRTLKNILKEKEVLNSGIRWSSNTHSHTHTGCTHRKVFFPMPKPLGKWTSQSNELTQLFVFMQEMAKPGSFLDRNLYCFRQVMKPVCVHRLRKVISYAHTSIHLCTLGTCDCSCGEQERLCFLPSNSPDLHFHIEIREHNLKIEMAINKIAHFHLDSFAEHSSLLDSGLVNVSCLPGSLSCHLILPCLKTASLHSKISQGKKFFLIHSFKTNQQVWI